MNGVNGISYYHYTAPEQSSPVTADNTPGITTSDYSDKVTLGSDTSSSADFRPYNAQGKVNDNLFNSGKAEQEPTGYMQQIMQAMLDRRIGFDREKWDELQEKIDAIQALENPSEEDLTKLEALMKEQQALTEEAARKLSEDTEKSAELPENPEL
ncbi:hypothetical protein QE250_05375 [Chromatiaceae bacterium AAb-1]|nr:hypothetical protein [Chromatiaceae bacterium AAb-1]